MADDSMPSRPDCDFNFNLPHGIDDEDADDANDMTEGAPTAAEMDTLFNDDDQNAQQTVNYQTFAEGFSDDEGGEEAFDRSWAGHKARKASPKQKKSPRRSEDEDGDDEATPRVKRPRKSLFGGPGADIEPEQPEDGEIEDEQLEDRVDEVEEQTTTPTEARPDIRQRMSSLNLDQQEAQDTRPYNLGFGLAPSERGSLSPARSRADSEDPVVIPPENGYGLRQNINRTRPMTYLDSDKTGNYDPSQEARIKSLQLQKAKAAKAAKKKGKGKGKEKVKKDHVMKCIVKLRIKAFGNVRNLTEDEENWPQGWSDIESDYEADTADICEFYRHTTPNPDVQTPIEDAKGEVDDLTGHPAARGCKNCRKKDVDCSMVEGGAYPCDQCEDEECECIPILEPTVKGRCKQCAVDGQDCSFEEDPDKAVCDYCTEHEFICEALPPRGYKTPRTSIDDVMYGPDRKHVQCTFCRMEKKRCSLKKKTNKPPCKHCKKNGIGCTFYDLPKTGRESKAAAKAKAKAVGPTDGDAPEVSMPSSSIFSPEDLEDMMREEDNQTSREPTPEIEMEDEAGNKGQLTKIKTSFAHPIKFSTQESDCSFCEMPAFGFVGHFEREVHVIAWYSGLGYTETGGGWCEERGATTMCETCTYARIQITCCPDHEIQAMFEDDETPDFDLLAEELCSAEALEDRRYQLQRWCSMCFMPARRGCGTVQPAITLDGSDIETTGCGLRLCDKCVGNLRDVHGGKVEDLVAEMDLVRPKVSEEDEQTGNLEGKARADVGFLRVGGLMMRNVNAGIEDAEMEE